MGKGCDELPQPRGLRWKDTTFVVGRLPLPSWSAWFRSQALSQHGLRSAVPCYLAFPTFGSPRAVPNPQGGALHWALWFLVMGRVLLVPSST